MSGCNDEQVINMDDILGAALDELDEDDDDAEDEKCPQQSNSSSEAAATTKQQPPPTSQQDDPVEEELEQLNSMMQEIFQVASGNNDTDEGFGNVMAKLQEQMKMEMEAIQKEETIAKEEATKTTVGDAAEDGSKKKKTVEPRRRPVFGPEPPPKETDVDRTISKLLNDMAASANTTEEDDVPGVDSMMDEFEKLGGDSMIDGMMQQLMSKDLMYEPIQEVTSKFPQWLEDNKSSLSEEEYENRCKQYKGLKNLLRVYEDEPENGEKLMELMKDVQEYGLPPTEIVSDIAPDLELDEDGVPKLKPGCCIM